jgi:hypothetical protein
MNDLKSMSTRPTYLRFYKPRPSKAINDREIDRQTLLPLWHQGTKKGKEGAHRSESLIIVLLVIVTFFFFIIILAAGTTLNVVVVGLHGHDVCSGKSSEGVNIKRRHRERKLVDAQLLVLAPLVAKEHILALTSVMTPSKHTLEHPKNST